MKLYGGYQPRVQGRPSSLVHTVAVPDRLCIPLTRRGVDYEPAVEAGAEVAFGAPLAWGTIAGGRVALPAPTAGRVEFSGDDPDRTIMLHVTDGGAAPRLSDPRDPDRMAAGEMREILAEAGIWPLIWSSCSHGVPALDGSDEPRRIIVNCVVAEPFRARGRVVLESQWEQIAVGMRFLARMLAEYGTIHVVLTDLSDPMAVMIKRELAGHAWVRIENVPVRYPIEAPKVLSSSLRRAHQRVRPDDTLWVMDMQAVSAVGGCMRDGSPLHERIVAVGGPGAKTPAHHRVRIGTPLNAILEDADCGSDRSILRGGLFQGEPTEHTSAVGFDDDGFFIIPRPQDREFLGFARPGFNRASILPCFASGLTRGDDRELSTSLRGERRPCIACGLCERVCPVELFPQVLHRYLYADRLDDAEKLGLPRCIACGLCSFVCPSKLDLVHEFSAASESIRLEREEAANAEAERERRESTKQHEKEHSEDWRQ